MNRQIAESRNQIADRFQSTDLQITKSVACILPPICNLLSVMSARLNLDGRRFV